MKHAIPVDKLGAFGKPMAAAVQACVHCGFCLPACPTYRLMGEEMDSPRGRITLMKNVLEGTLPLENALPHLDACLGCLSCETACPSGVEYRELISPFRALSEAQRDRPLMEKLKRWVLLRLLPHPGRFEFAARLGIMMKPFVRLLPSGVRTMLELLPARLPRPEPLQDRYIPQRRPRAKVTLLTGCAQQVLAPEINRATIEVLLQNDVEVIVPRQQVCCGALAWHVGAHGDAAKCAAQNVAAFPDDVDAVITNAAGCGSCLHEYPLILSGRDDARGSELFARKAVDVSVFLDRLGFIPPPPVREETVVAMQDACHLLHGQRVQSAPRRLLQAIGGVEIREIADAEICCGSAGTYNLDQPEVAAILGGKKVENLLATGARFGVSGNIGCITQIRAYMKSEGRPMVICHTMELLAMAYRGAL
jgi:glycolate oxidase iron-sulfur subunit